LLFPYCHKGIRRKVMLNRWSFSIFIYDDVDVKASENSFRATENSLNLPLEREPKNWGLPLS
jgi:hypothetical protein